MVRQHTCSGGGREPAEQVHNKKHRHATAHPAASSRRCCTTCALAALPCTYIIGVCEIHDARHEIVHRGQLPVGRKRPDTWLITAHLLRQVLGWFATDPEAEIGRLDSEISSLPTPPP
jgi:hypothetical protein